MTIEYVLANLQSHEARSQARYEELRDLINVKETAMTEPVSVKNIFETPNSGMASILPMMAGMGGGSTGAAVGGGLGAGLLGGVLGSALLGRNGVLGGGVDNAGVVTPALLASSLAQVTDTAQNTTVLQTLGDIKASVPLAEGQVQLALAGAQSTLMNQASMNQLGVLAGQAGITKSVSEAIAASLASQNAINVNVLNSAASIKESIASFGVANLTATTNAQTAITAAVRDDGEKTCALINQQNIDNLQRMLTVAESTALENRLLSNARDNSVTVTQTVNQNQVQLQAQAQQQQQAVLLSNLMYAVNGLQNAVATNSNMIIGNTGAVGTGTQTANPVNVRT